MDNEEWKYGGDQATAEDIVKYAKKGARLLCLLPNQEFPTECSVIEYARAGEFAKLQQVGCGMFGGGWCWFRVEDIKVLAELPSKTKQQFVFHKEDDL
jgi:hypothetical protein